MYKKSITRIENENESSRADLSSPAMHDIIATNHVVLAKKPHKERFSRACKALMIMIILALVAIGIIVLTLVLAHSRNTLMAIIARSAEENALSTMHNNSRFLLINHENFTTITNEEQTETSSASSTVILTSNNLPRLTTPNLHLSSISTIQTEQFSDYSSRSSNRMFDEQSTILLSTSEEQITTDNQLTTTRSSEEDIFTSSGDHPMLSTVDSTMTFNQEETTGMPEETSSFTAYLTRHFDIQSSSMVHHPRKFVRPSMIEEDVLDDVFFS